MDIPNKPWQWNFLSLWILTGVMLYGAPSQAQFHSPLEIAGTMGGTIGNGAATVNIVGQKVHTVTVVGKKPLLDATALGCVPPPDYNSWGVTTYSAPIILPGLTNAPSDDCRVSPMSRHPVIIATGEKVHADTDFTDFSLAGLSMTRVYRSKPSSQKARLFGARWYSSFDFPQLEYSTTCTNEFGHSSHGCFPDWVNVSLPDGRTYTYSFAGFPIYLPRGYQGGTSPLGHLLATDPAVFKVIIADRTYVYDRRQRNLLSIDEHGQRLLSFEYSPVGPDFQLQSVTARNGRVVRFKWSSSISRVTGVIDSNGSVWRYLYDSLGNLIQVVSPASQKVQPERSFHYEDSRDPLLLTGTSFDGVRRLRVAYDQLGRVLKSGFDNDQEFDEFEYQEDTTTVRIHTGHAVRFEFEPRRDYRRLVRAVRLPTKSVGESEMTQHYASSALPIRVVDWNGVPTNFKYSPYDILEEVTLAAGSGNEKTIRYQWNGSRLERETHIDAAGRSYYEMSTSYGQGLASNLPLEVTKTDLLTGQHRKLSYNYAFHPNGMMSSQETVRHLPDGVARTVDIFDTVGNLLTRTNALGHLTRYAYYHKPGLPAWIEDANGYSTVEYDAFGRITSIGEGPYSRKTKFQYGSDGAVTSVYRSVGGATHYQYSTAGKLTHVIDSRGDTITYSAHPWEWANNVRSIRSPRFGAEFNGNALLPTAMGEFTSKVELDSMGRPWKEYGEDGVARTNGYDANGNLVKMVESSGGTWQFEYNAMNQRTATISPAGTRTRFEYDSRGNLAAYIDMNGARTSFEYNGFGDVEVENHPDAGRSTFNYDSAGRLVSHHRPDGTTVNYSWDALDRLVLKTAGSLQHEFGYDEGKYGLGRLTRFSDESGTTRLKYDFYGNVSEQINTILSIFGGEFKTKWYYNLYGVQTGVRYPDGTTLSFDLDEQSRVKGIRSSLPFPSTLIASVLRQPVTGDKLGWVHGNGIADIRLSDQSGRIAASSTFGLANRALDYGVGTDRIQAIREPERFTESRTFQYDDLGRLSSETGPSGVDRFDLDATGNRLNHHTPSGSVAYSYFSGTNRLKQVSGAVDRSYNYDASGNQTSAGAFRYGYDEFGRLASAELGTVGTAFHYNAMGHRVRKNDKNFIYGPDGTLLFERGNTSTNYVWLDGDLIGILRNKAYFSVHTDHLGRPEFLTDKNKKVVWRATLSAFDRKVQIDEIGGFHLGFPGQYWDEETKLWYNWQRYYDADTGRYLSVDPIRSAESGPYTYANANPVAYVDKEGLTPEGALKFVAMIQKRFPRNPNLTTRSDGLPQGYGCGNKSTDILVPDLFPKSCEAHDDCYAAQCGKSFCDKKFLEDMRKERPDLTVSPYLYYWGVRLGGDAAYKAGAIR